jgi:transcriptional regulator with XRE-family HTH domain
MVITRMTRDGGIVMEAVRGYLRELRLGQHISQDKLAEVMGITKQALLDWEKGRTQDIKTGPMLKAVRYLRGRLEDIASLADATFEKGAALAAQRLAEPPLELNEEQKSRLQSLADSVTDEQLFEMINLLVTLKQNNKDDQWITFGRFLTKDE